MLVTLSGIVTLVRLVHHRNAPSPMLTTGKPFIVLGMTTSPPGPVYLVIMTVLRLDRVFELGLHHEGQDQEQEQNPRDFAYS
jgi:hypothetical protein